MATVRIEDVPRSRLRWTAERLLGCILRLVGIAQHHAAIARRAGVPSKSFRGLNRSGQWAMACQ
jgi:hypothetical protein